MPGMGSSYTNCVRGVTGYTFVFHVYEGRNSQLEPTRCPSRMGNNWKILGNLMSLLFYQGYHLYMDNSHPHVPHFGNLFLTLNHSLWHSGTKSQRLPSKLVNARQKKGGSQQICAMNFWQLNRKINRMFISFHLFPQIPKCEFRKVVVESKTHSAFMSIICIWEE